MPTPRAPRTKAGAYRPPSGPNRNPVKRKPSQERERAPRSTLATRPASVRKAAAAPPGPLTASQKRYLRGLAHDLKPVVLIGQKGVTPALLLELDGALAHHELIKVKLADDDRESRTASIEAIRASSDAELVQTIGKVACFYRRNPDKSQFDLPK